MRRWSFLLVMVLALLLPLTVEAQAGLEFEKVNVAIWPEYDRPDVLVIYHLSLSSKITYRQKSVFAFRKWLANQAQWQCRMQMEPW